MLPGDQTAPNRRRLPAVEASQKRLAGLRDAKQRVAGGAADSARHGDGP